MRRAADFTAAIAVVLIIVRTCGHMLRVRNEQQQGEKPVLGGDAGDGTLRQHADLRILPIYDSMRDRSGIVPTIARGCLVYGAIFMPSTTNALFRRAACDVRAICFFCSSVSVYPP